MMMSSVASMAGMTTEATVKSHLSNERVSENERRVTFSNSVTEIDKEES